MTTRELYTAAIAALRETEPDSALASEFEALVAKMDAQNAARKIKSAEKAAEAQSEEVAEAKPKRVRKARKEEAPAEEAAPAAE